MSRLVVLFAFCCSVAAAAITFQNGQPKVTTQYGTILGLKETLASGKSVYTFQGVPFAKPPVGDLRFEKSVPPENFGTINATSKHIPCVQFVGVQAPTAHSEDCLYLNIATPNYTLPFGKKFPVMIYVFGGGFITGNGNSKFCPDFHERFVTQGIVYITIQYRIGPLGFYSTGDSTAPGNYGLWDQVQSIRFVKEVIAQFNGDPNQITLFGESAGAIAVSYLTHSPLVKGLIKQALPYCHSARGSANRENSTYFWSNHMEEALGCDTAANKKDCLKTKPLSDIIEAERKPWGNNADRIDDLWYTPRIDGELIQGTDLKDALNHATKVTTFLGLNSMENIAFAMNMLGTNSNNATVHPVQQADGVNFTEANMEYRIRYLLALGNHYGEHEQEALDEIVNFYKNEALKYPVNGYLQAFVQFSTDIHFNIGAVREARFKAASGRLVFFYQHDFHLPNYRFNNPLLPVGNGHCQENPYLFGNYNGIEPPLNGTYLKNMKEFVKMWISYVKFGIPIHSGKPLLPATPFNVPYLYINDGGSIKLDLWGDRYRFWKRIAEKYGYDWVTGRTEAN